MKRILLASAALLALADVALAQSSPGFTTGQIPTAAQWNSYFAAKQDYPGGGAVTWPTTGNLVVSNGTQSPGGLAPIDGDCPIGSGGIWTVASCTGGGITALTGDVTASGSGSVAATVAKINGVALGSTTATAGSLLIGSGTQWVTHAISGDGTLGATGLFTLATVNANVGTFGDSSHCANFTVNAKGLITAAAQSTSCPGAGGSGITALTGDGTASGSGSVAFTLATVNSNVGTFGDGAHVAQVTLNAKGLATAASSVAIATGAGLTNTASALALTDLLCNSGAVISGTTYPINLTPPGDLARECVFTGSSNSAWSLGASAPGEGFGVSNQGTANITITATGNINGASTLVIAPGQYATVFAGASTWYAGVAGIVGSVVAGTNVTISGQCAPLTGSCTINSSGGGGGNGIVLLQTIDVSTPQTTINIALTAGYKKYRLETWGMAGSAGVAIRMLVSNNGGSTYFNAGTDYYQNLIYLLAPSTTPAGTSGNIGYVGVGDIVLGSNYRYVNNMDIDPGDGTYFPAFFTNQTGDGGTVGSPTQLIANVEVWLKTATAINAIQLFADTGTITSGHIRLWGIQ